MNWGLAFGDENITINMARNVLNSFDVVNGKISDRSVIVLIREDFV